MTSLLSLAVIPFAVTAAPTASSSAEEASPSWRVYVGTYTQGASTGIYLLVLDPLSGRLEMQGVACETENPSFLAMHPTKPVLYAVAEMGLPEGVVSAFQVDVESGLLTLLNRRATKGPGPCHVAVAPSGRHVAVANYTGGSVALLPVLDDGQLGEATGFVQHEGHSVNPQRQEGPHAHSVNFDAAGRFLFAADLGADKVFVYPYDEDTGSLAAQGAPFVELAPGAGPRHFTFHPSSRYAYVVNELDNTVTVFAYDTKTGHLQAMQSIGTLPDGFESVSHTAEIRVHPSGRFLYASNRGHDSIAVFAFDLDSGTLTALDHTPTGGETPRNFNIDPTGNFLLVANQSSDNVVVFRIDAESGRLTPTGHAVKVPSPVCVLFAATQLGNQ
jgi:6-phosphogluconolactonase